MDAVVLIVLAAAVFGSVALVTIGLAGLVSGNTSRLISAREAQSERQLQDLFIRDVSARQVTAMTLGGTVVAFLLVFLLTGSLFMAIVMGAAAYFAPTIIFGYLRDQRMEAFDNQLPDALVVLANSTRAGMSLVQGIEQVTEQLQGPVADEFGLILQEVRLGQDVPRAIDAARDRMPTRGFRLVATALQVNREKGGNLPEALTTMSQALQEIWRLEQKLITASSEGRKAVWVISGMPLFITLFVGFFQPSLMDTMTGSLFGIILLILAVLFYGAGLYWLLQILKRDV